MSTEKIIEKTNGNFKIASFVVANKYIKFSTIIVNNTHTKNKSEMKFIRYK